MFTEDGYKENAVDPEIAAGHMTDNGEPMTADDRCLRLEEQMKDMRDRMEKSESQVRRHNFMWLLNILALVVLLLIVGLLSITS